MLTELVRPTEVELLTPVANREPFALRAAATTMMSIAIAVTDTRSHLPSLLGPGATTEPINLVILGANARTLPKKDTATPRPQESLRVFLLSLHEALHDSESRLRPPRSPRHR